MPGQNCCQNKMNPVYIKVCGQYFLVSWGPAWALGYGDGSRKTPKMPCTFPDTLLNMYFAKLRGVYFLALFD